MRISKARKLFGESRRLTSLQLCVSFIFETCKYFDPLFLTVAQCVWNLFEVAKFNYSRYFFSYLNQTFNRLRKQSVTIFSSRLKKNSNGTSYTFLPICLFLLQVYTKLSGTFVFTEKGIGVYLRNWQVIYFQIREKIWFNLFILLNMSWTFLTQMLFNKCNEKWWYDHFCGPVGNEKGIKKG